MKMRTKTPYIFMYVRILVVTLFFLAAIIPKVHGEELFRKDDLSLCVKGAVTAWICVVLYCAYEFEKEKYGDANATPYIIGASIPIGWFLFEVVDEVTGRKAEVKKGRK